LFNAKMSDFSAIS